MPLSHPSRASTPWGMADYETTYAPGVVCYSTPSHGGFILSPEANLRVPAALRRPDRTYEEDCHAARVIVAFPEFFPAETIASAWRSIQYWAPEAYARLSPSDRASPRSLVGGAS